MCRVLWQFWEKREEEGREREKLITVVIREIRGTVIHK